MRTVDITHWSFTLEGDREAWAKNYDDGAWRTVRVPHDWAVEQAFSPEHASGTGYLAGGVGWYRAHVSLTALELPDDAHVRLVFAGVYKNADVWVNGYHVGGRPSGYAAFSFDLTEIVSYATDDDLVVCVRVEHIDLADSRWYNGAGMTRRVALEVHRAVRISECGTIVTTPFVDADEATVRVAQTLINDTDQPVRVHVAHELCAVTSGRARVFGTEIELPAGDSAIAVAETIVPDPELWSDAEPNLYRLVTTLRWTSAPSGTGAAEKGERTSQYDLVTGIRSFSFHPDRGFFVNGQRRVLKGVCLHEDAGPVGTAVPAEVWLRRLLTLKRAGANAVRMAHNPHAPELYALCDALGLYVIDEAFDEWENPKNKWWQGHNVYPPRHGGPAKDFPAWHERDLVAMVEAHRHHPSIVAWSIGNEVDYPNDPYASPLFEEMTGNNDANKPAAERVYDPNRPDIRRLTTIATRLAAIVRAVDQTRPVTLAAAFPELSSRTGLLGPLDLVGYNYKEHLYARDHRRFPDKPFVGSENGHGYRQWLDVVEQDFVAGQFLWTGVDYLGEAHGWPIHGSGAGLLTLAGFEKHAWHLRRSWWSDDPVARLVTRRHVEGHKTFWSHPVSRAWGSAESLTEVLCFANGEPALSVGGEAVALTRDDEIGCWTATLPPSSAPLVLEVRRDGLVVARDELTAAGPVARIDAGAWRAPAAAVRRCADVGVITGDVLQLECTLRDASGRPAIGDILVTVEVDGGTLLGIENGDLADNTPYSEASRRTLDGRLLVLVRATADTTTVRLSAPSIPTTTVRE